MIDKIPENLLNEFTQNNTIPIVYKIINDNTEEIQNEINSNFNQKTFELYCEKAKLKQKNYYGDTDEWLYQAIDKYSFQDKNICIFGSANPWYEAICLANNANKITVIEYSDRKTFNNKINYIKPHENYNEKFDVLLSISSFEHDGLGRYGDPINPNGDLDAMKKAKIFLKDDGLLFLSVPIGQDCLCFNAHRIYGKNRFFRLIQDWNVVETFGFYDNCFDFKINGINGTPYQPIIVLKK